MHAIHTTPGFIIDSRPYGEAGKMISIFTRDFGLVSAVAQGIRLEKSKLRYFAQDYSLGIFSLVRGKELWRLTSAQDGPLVAEGKDSLEILARVSLLLRRLLQGEEPHPELFDLVESLAAFLKGNAALSAEEMRALESLSVFRMLDLLGYIGDDSSLAEFAGRGQFTREILGQAAVKRAALNQHINKALKESHL